jgi:hypothetical protein
MLPNQKKKAHNCIGAAILLSVTGFVLTVVHTPLAPLAPPVSFSAIPIVVMGACAFAKAKGYHWSLGLLILTTLPGLFVLMLIKDRHPETANQKGGKL